MRCIRPRNTGYVFNNKTHLARLKKIERSFSQIHSEGQAS